VGLAYAALSVAAVIWGLSFPVLKFTVDRLGPLDVAVSRIVLGALGGLLLLPLAPGGLPDLARLARRRPGRLAALSVLAGYGQNLALTYGLVWTPAVVASLVPPLNPVLTLVLAWLLLGERIDARRWVGVALAVTGVGLLGLRNGWPTWQDVTGPLTCALAPLSWACYTVLSKPLLHEVAPLHLNALTLLGGALAVVPVLGVSGLARLAVATPGEIAAVLFLGLGTVTVGYALWYVGLARVGAASAGATVLAVPLIGVLGSWALLGEALGPVVPVAALLVLGGLRMVLGRRG
jgi:drug/metabolite transporter (DMT)-like permease